MRSSTVANKPLKHQNRYLQINYVHIIYFFDRCLDVVDLVVIIFHTVQDTFSVYCVPGYTPVPQNPMNAMVMVMVKLILNATSPECYISLPLTPSSSPLPPYVFPSPLISPPPPPTQHPCPPPLFILCLSTAL